jgi:iron complex transport system substrate-binding protein
MRAGNAGLFVLFVSCGALSACSSCRTPDPGDGDGSGGAVAEGSAPGAVPEGSVAPVVVERVVSIVPAATELLWAIGAGDLVVGRSQQCNYPPMVATVPSVGSGLAPDLERILALRPTVVVAGALQRDAEVIPAIEAAGIDVLFLPDNRVDDVPRALRLLGERLDRRSLAEAAAIQFEARLGSLRARDDRPVEPPAAQGELPRVAPGGTAPLTGQQPVAPAAPHRALVVIDRDPLFAAGPDSFVGEVVEIAGVENILTEGAWVQIDDETVLRANPDMIIESREGSGDTYWAERFPQTQAVLDNRLCTLDPDILSRVSLRILDGIEIIRLCDGR